MAGVLRLSAVSIVAKHREWRSNEGCGQKGIFRATPNEYLYLTASTLWGVLVQTENNGELFPHFIRTFVFRARNKSGPLHRFQRGTIE